MNAIMITLFLDVTVAVLLAVTIYFCTKLNKRVKQLQDSKSELAQLIQQFDESTQAATVSITEIQRASKKINENMQAKLDKANYLADDLAFMIERANKTADRIEQQLSQGRNATSGNAAQPRVNPADAREPRANRPIPTPEEAGSQAAMLRQPHPRSGSATVAEEKPRATASGMNRASVQESAADKKGIEAMMDRIAELRNNRNGSKAEQRPMARMRSKSEQDLLAALKRDDKRV